LYTKELITLLTTTPRPLQCRGGKIGLGAHVAAV
jgi:hypothetical protein